MLKTVDKPPTPLRAIRAKCHDCTDGQPKEVRFCPATDCPLYPFRLGKSPRPKSFSAEQRQTAAVQMKKNRRPTPKQAVLDGFCR